MPDKITHSQIMLGKFAHDNAVDAVISIIKPLKVGCESPIKFIISRSELSVLLSDDGVAMKSSITEPTNKKTSDKPLKPNRDNANSIDNRFYMFLLTAIFASIMGVFFSLEEIKRKELRTKRDSV